MRFGLATIRGTIQKKKSRARATESRWRTFSGTETTKTAGKFIVFGSTGADHILSLDVLPTPSETVTGNHYQVAFGDKGANQAVAAGRSGASIAFIACIGDDNIGEHVRRQLVSNGIDVASVHAVAGEVTGAALIFVSAEDESVIGIHTGASAVLSVSQVGAEKERVASVQALLTQLESSLKSMLAVAKIAHCHQTIVVLNSALARELSDELLALADIITLNKTEAGRPTGICVESDEDVAKATNVLHAKGIGTMMITLNSRSIWLSAEGESRRISGFHVQAIDTIVAGDTFNGALVTALLEGTSLSEAIRFTHAAAAVAVIRKGMQSFVPRRTKIDEFLA